jgi:hypothetical protein
VRENTAALLLHYCITSSFKKKEDMMDIEMKRQLARELATRINAAVNIPFIKEEDEQAFFEMLVMLVLQALLKVFEKKA